jgi:hypothetical protein
MNSLLAVFLALTVAPVAVASPLLYRKVALTGEPAPGTEAGTTFAIFTTGLNHSIMVPQIDERGRVAIIALVQGAGVGTTNRSGIWAEDDGELKLVVRTGMHAPGTPSGVVFSGVPNEYLPFPPSFSEGRASFQGELSGAGVEFSNNEGFWTGDAAGISLVARKGDPAPGLPQGVEFLGPIGGSIGTDGTSRVVAPVLGPGIGSRNDDAIWSDRTGSLSAIVREGNPVPGMAPGVVFGSGVNLGSSYTFPLVQFNDGSQLAVQAGLVGPGIDSFNDEGIFVERNGALVLVARDGDDAPGYDNGGFFGGGSVSAHFFSLVHNDAGHVAFIADVGESNWRDTVIYSDRSGSLLPVVRAGDPAPGTGATLTIFGGPVLNDEGRIAFAGSIATGQWPPLGVFSDATGQLAPLILPGAQLAGMSFLGTGGIVGFNVAGEVAFRADFDDPVEGFKSGLVLADRVGNLSLVAATGSLFDVQGDGSDLRRILRVEPGGLSESGSVVFRLDFTDNSSGHFTATARRPGVATGLRMDKAGDGALRLTWDADCAGSTSYGIYRGDLILGLASLAPEPSQCMAVSGVEIPAGSGATELFLVVPNVGGFEGSYGVDSAGRARPAAAGACFPPGELDVCAR